MYTDRNFKTKKDLVAAFLSGEKLGTYQPGGMFPATRDGWIALEGPHYPQPHRWYASARVEGGYIVELKGVKTPAKAVGGPGAPPPAPAPERKGPSPAAVLRSARADENAGFCTGCGHKVYGVEPDAFAYKCERCGANRVYGAMELVMTGYGQF